PKKAVDSLAFTSTMDNEELKYFLSLRHQTSVAFKIYGTEPIPGCMLSPSYIGVIIPLELKKSLHKWYEILYKAIKIAQLYFQNGKQKGMKPEIYV
ncbi:45834_t:CDS:2, partial [Gigaspora margarita]